MCVCVRVCGRGTVVCVFLCINASNYQSTYLPIYACMCMSA